ncbi:MAG: hypothetical protein J1F69_00090 [Clostridiales bacterium]|nr:hypothetical protein [Clostridiales bacterium]
MRKLTVKRKWSIVECFPKIYLYVQCERKHSTHNVNGNYFIRIRIKNGKTVTADITDEPTIIMIGSNTAYTPYTVPAGTDDVNLLTKPHYSPAKGNPFTFEKC